MGRTKMWTNIQHCENIDRGIPETDFPCDFIKEHLFGERFFKIVIRTRKQWLKDGYPEMGPLEVVCHTDGSLTSGLSGAAFTYSEGTAEGVYPLGRYATVFQAEICGIIEAVTSLTHIMSGRDYKINIFVDSLGALKALMSASPSVGLVRECWHLLNNIAGTNEVTLYWIPAHSGFSGNERVDELAGMATTMAFYGPQPVISVSESFVASAIQLWSLREHTKAWKLGTDCRQTRSFVEGPASSITNYLRSLNRKALRLLIQVISGHSTLNRHLFIMGLTASPNCAYCGEEEETSAHFVCVCPFFNSIRYETLGSHTVDLGGTNNIPLTRLLDFISKSGRFASIPNGDG